MTTSNRSYLAVLSFALLLAVGCSFSPVKNESSFEMPAEQQTVIAPVTNPIALPDAVAKDIARINAGQDVEESIPNQVASSQNMNEVKKVGVDQVKAENIEVLSDQLTINDQTQSAKDDTTRSPSSVEHINVGQSINYTVKRGDTLMKISFEKYGNLYRWKDIYDMNRNKISSVNYLVPGMVLQIEGVEYVVIEKNGSPYLIKRADTLLKISKKLYGQQDKWKNLWNNNRQLIHDPNKIYAGFTMYYQAE